MKYYVIEPEVAGGWGNNTIVADRNVHPPRVSRLHYQFDGWLGDVLLESSPCYVVTEEAKRSIEAIGTTGAKFDEVEISTSEQFNDLYPDRRLPRFAWLQVEGKAGQDDFGIAPAPDFRLVISQRILDLLRPLGIANALVEEFEQPSLSEP
jgi:hypothetical protein